MCGFAEGVPLRQGQERGQQGHEGPGEYYAALLVLCSRVSYSYTWLVIWCSDPWRRVVVQLGGKGANLAEMSSIGLSVPPGFTVSTEACQQYQEAGRALPAGLWAEILDGLAWVEEYMGARLGDPQRPLLLSVRSGAAVS